MKPTSRRIACVTLWCGFLVLTAAGQQPPAILTVELDNIVMYLDDVNNFGRLATNPNAAAAQTARNFVPVVWIADVVSVNGRPAKGTWTFDGTLLLRAAAPQPGSAIADIPGVFAFHLTCGIQQADGTPVGTIMASGWGGSPRPPGAPAAILQADMAVTGGTGAYLGMRGQVGQGGITTNGGRTASMAEDPANRRLHGGGGRRYVFHLVPMSQPGIVVGANGPQIFHADFSPVTSVRPARSGETLIVRATGLGPTRPGVNPGQEFPSNPVQEVTHPSMCLSAVKRLRW